MKDVAAECVNKTDHDIVQFKKLAEGGSDRVYKASPADASALGALASHSHIVIDCQVVMLMLHL